MSRAMMSQHRSQLWVGARAAGLPVADSDPVVQRRGWRRWKWGKVAVDLPAWGLTSGR